MDNDAYVAVIMNDMRLSE